MREIERRATRLDLLDIENVVDQADQPLGVLVCDRHQPAGLFRQTVRPLSGQQAERAGDRSQRRTQFVTNGGNELILQPLHLLAVADIDDHRQHQQPLARPNRVEADFDGEFAAVLAPTMQLTASFNAAVFRLRRKVAAVKDVLRPRPLRHQQFDVPADQLFPRVAELVLDLGIDHHHLAAVGHHHSTRAGLDREPEHFLGEAPLGNIWLDGGHRLIARFERFH